MADTIPTLPMKMSVRMILLLTGWETTYYDSEVVKPVPEKEDWA